MQPTSNGGSHARSREAAAGPGGTRSLDKIRPAAWLSRGVERAGIEPRKVPAEQWTRLARLAGRNSRCSVCAVPRIQGSAFQSEVTS